MGSLHYNIQPPETISQTRRPAQTVQPSGTSQTFPTDHQPPKFPSTAGRQRSSNVNTSNADDEFQRTALNACRSTITQQGVEIKKLNEALDIRNKRILQLEAQIGHASDLFSDRASNGESNSNLYSDIFRTVERLAEKVSQSHNVPTTNIVINSCQAGNPNNIKHEVSTQTDLSSSSSNLPSGSTEAPNSNEEETKNSQESATNFYCEFCGCGFANNDHLNTHINTTHNDPSLPAENTGSADDNSL
jgi:hypothetical protein